VRRAWAGARGRRTSRVSVDRGQRTSRVSADRGQRMKEPLFGKTLFELRATTDAAGLPAYSAAQIADWLYKKNAESFDAMLNLPKRARAFLSDRFTPEVRGPLKSVESSDGTRKYLFPAGESGFVEAAFIPEEDRATLCLSVQVGCKMGCLFCMTGRQGFQGNLSAGEILSQFRSLPEREKITNIVYMGMGEPLDNLENVLSSLEILTSDYGFAMSPTRITVSTIGMLPALESYLDRNRCHLAVSLHTPFEGERQRLVPMEKVHPIRDILSALKRRAWDGQRRVSFEYIVLDGVNDTPRHVAELVKALAGLRCRVNLIPFHPIPNTTLAPSPRERIEIFENLLREGGILATIRQSRGLDISAACGLLSTRELNY
jgi:23S rRNA (adenine2503-C2)-methyltransferase